MIRWEYRSYETPGHIAALNELGADGWEAVGFSPHGWLLLKRPLGESMPVDVGRRGPLQLSARARRSVTRVDP